MRETNTFRLKRTKFLIPVKQIRVIVDFLFFNQNVFVSITVRFIQPNFFLRVLTEFSLSYPVRSFVRTINYLISIAIKTKWYVTFLLSSAQSIFTLGCDFDDTLYNICIYVWLRVCVCRSLVNEITVNPKVRRGSLEELFRPKLAPCWRG